MTEADAANVQAVELGHVTKDLRDAIERGDYPEWELLMVWHFLLVEDDLGLRVGEGLSISPSDVAHLEPLASQDLTNSDRERLANLGKSGSRNVEGLQMTHCVPNERAVVDAEQRGKR